MKFPHEIKLYKELIRCYLALQQKDEVIATARSALKLTPYSTKLFAYISIFSAEAGDLKEAADCMKKSLQLMYLPDYIPEYCDLLISLEGWQEMADETQKALTITETIEPLFQNHVLALRTLGKTKEAENFIADVKGYMDSKGWRIE